MTIRVFLNSYKEWIKWNYFIDELGVRHLNPEMIFLINDYKMDIEISDDKKDDLLLLTIQRGLEFKVIKI
jgi:hypothetical protein